MSAGKALYVSVVLFAISSIYVNVFLNQGNAAVSRESLASFPTVLGEWSGKDQKFSSDILENLGVDEYVMRQFENGKDSVWLYIGYYKSQKEGAVPHSPRHCYPGAGWFVLQNDVADVLSGRPGGTTVRVNRYVFAKGDDRECVIYWYQSRGRAVADEYMEKIYLIRDTIFRNRSDGALVRLSTRSTEGREGDAMRRLEQFATVIYPRLSKYVPD